MKVLSQVPLLPQSLPCSLSLYFSVSLSVSIYLSLAQLHWDISHFPLSIQIVHDENESNSYHLLSVHIVPDGVLGSSLYQMSSTLTLTFPGKS